MGEVVVVVFFFQVHVTVKFFILNDPLFHNLGNQLEGYTYRYRETICVYHCGPEADDGDFAHQWWQS